METEASRAHANSHESDGLTLTILGCGKIPITVDQIPNAKLTSRARDSRHSRNIGYTDILD